MELRHAFFEDSKDIIGATGNISGATKAQNL